MADRWSKEQWHLELMSRLAFGGALVELFFGIAFSGERTLAQITPDNTLGAERSNLEQVTRDGLPSELIKGGARRGINLFHSFAEFNVREGQGAYFDNSVGIENILSRVTGGSRSEILGRLGVLGGNANLFLINPNGILFGPNASLDVRGSFVATTANAVQFGNQGFFSASEPNATPLLTINPSAFLFNQIAVAQQPSVTINSRRLIGLDRFGFPIFEGLRVPDGKTLALVGGDVILEGGNLTAPGGLIEIGSVAGVGEVSLKAQDSRLILGYEPINTFGNIQISKGAFVDASGNGGGDIQIRGSQLQMTGRSFIFADTQGTGTGGEILIETTNAIALSEGSRITSDLIPEATGTGGNITIKTGQLSILNIQEGTQSLIRSGNFGQGQGGNLTVIASDLVKLVGQSSLSTGTQTTGAAGNLLIQTKRLSVRDNAIVFTGTFRQGQGQGGDLTVIASDKVELLRGGGLYTQTQGVGAAGGVVIETKQLTVGEGSQVSTSTFGQGESGDILVKASDAVNLFGVSPRVTSGLFARTSGVRQGGNITVETSAFRVADGAVVDSRTTGAGNGGSITIKADTFEAVNGGQVVAGSFNKDSSGVAGNITLNVTEDITISGSLPNSVKRFISLAPGQVVENTDPSSSGLFVLSRGTNQAGSLTVTARSILLENQGEINAQSDSGQGGDINLNAQDLLLLRGGSEITATAGIAGAGGDGGNINIDDTQFVIAIPGENSDITAKAVTGRGGNIRIDAQGIFGFTLQQQSTTSRDDNNTNDITASSQLGIDGIITLNTPDLDPSQGLISIPTTVVDVSRLIAQGCNVGDGTKISQFVITGRGGLPPNPGQAFSSEALWEDLRPQSVRANYSAHPTNPVPELSNTAQAAIVEASGWLKNEQGEITLIATVPNPMVAVPGTLPQTCHAD